MDAQETTQQRSEAQGTEREKARQFLEEYVGSHMTTEERVTAFVLLTLALKDRAMADTIKGLLWDRAEFCFEDVDWHKRVEREDSPEAVRDIQSVLNFWRIKTGAAVPEPPQAEVEAAEPQAETEPKTLKFPKEAQPQYEDEAQGMVAEAIANPPKPKEKSTWDETIEDASETEKVIVNWLLKQSYATKLACVILWIWLNGDHNTEGITNDILGRWSDEVLANVKNPPDNLSREELAMSGVAAEAEVWLENL